MSERERERERERTEVIVPITSNILKVVLVQVSLWAVQERYELVRKVSGDKVRMHPCQLGLHNCIGEVIK